jgi:catechol 2,3-dioxygenase-like lactoylglutathione lyase family enzyme
MIDHMTYRVRDLKKTKAFYQAALKPIGYEVGYEGVHDGVGILGFISGGKIDTWFVEGVTPVSGPTHVCWAAKSRDEVDAFYKAALAAGGQDNGAPGLRPHYHAQYYGAFVLDPDGNNAEAVFHGG